LLKFVNSIFFEYNTIYFSGNIGIDTRNRIWVNSWSGPPYYTETLEIRNAEDYSYIRNSQDLGVQHCLKNGETWMGITDYIVQIRNDSSFYYDTTMLQIPFTGFLDACSDNNGVVWIANALGVLKFENNEFTRYDTSNTELEAPVWSITCDPNNRIWLGTDSGLIKFDTVNGSIFNTGNSPLPYNKITKVMADKFGNIWMLCTDGTNTSFCVYREGGVMLNTPENYYSSGNNVEVYPNPTYAECRMRIRAGKGLESEVKLYDLQGRLVYSTETTEQEITIDLSQLPAGVYYCAVSNEKYKETVKVVKL
jgi:hypothetical protein